MHTARNTSLFAFLKCNLYTPKDNLYTDFRSSRLGNFLVCIFRENERSYLESFWNTFPTKEQQQENP